MKVHYKHQQGDPRCTIAIEEVPKYKLQDLINFGISELQLSAGVTWVHPKDQYVKRVGRDKVMSKLVPVYAQLIYVKIQQHANRIVYDFYAHIPDTRGGLAFQTELKFGLSITPESQKVHLEYAYVD